MSSRERPQDCATRSAIGLGSGFAAGALFGAVSSNWGEVPVVLRNKPWPALVRTGQVMAQYGTTLGVVGLSFSAVECAAETVRGKKDWKNGVLASAAAGSALGLRVGRLGVALGAAASFAAVSLAVDMSGESFVSEGFEDGATPRRRIYPYSSS